MPVRGLDDIMDDHVLITLSKRYPQLLLPMGEGEEHDALYRDVVLRGKSYEGKPDFSLSDRDTLVTVATPAGDVDVLTLFERTDFEHCICALTNRCHPMRVPATQGASMISGLINWEKIHRHKMMYLLRGGKDWGKEWEEFRKDKTRYTDRLIVLSSGYYSSLSPEEAGMTPEEWREKSMEIRKYHELTHFVSRQWYPEDISALRDEIFADAIGLFMALGKMDQTLACRFLGIGGDGTYHGGRLENYVSAESLAAAAVYAAERIRQTAEILDGCDAGAPEAPWKELKQLFAELGKKRFPADG